MASLEQILRKSGYTDQELTALGPMLADKRFRDSLEKELTTMEAATAKANHDLDEYDKWFTNEITPEHQKLVSEHADAVAEAAAAKAKLGVYQSRGGKPTQKDLDDAEAAETERKRTEAALKNSNLDASKYVTTDVFHQTVDKTGEAVAGAIDLVSDFMQLFPGQQLNMTQARAEAKAAKKPVRQYVEEKYGFDAKRNEISAKATADNEAKIRADERQKLMVEFGGSNPNLIAPGPSNNPFVIRKQAKETKQPWERTPNDLTRDRVEKAVQKAATRGELTTA